jgi:hypothetical protein
MPNVAQAGTEELRPRGGAPNRERTKRRRDQENKGEEGGGIKGERREARREIERENGEKN